MKSTSLATIVLSAVVMTIASDSVATPIGQPCSPANEYFAACYAQTAYLRLSTDKPLCEPNSNAYNNGYDYGIHCGSTNKVVSFEYCHCKGCCAIGDGQMIACIPMQ
ncbi:uncharacterized protein EDB93DRAFT_563109 [Suillus bovinus]|uniref:uncharacterized protein n=1 Tax=Suillus bovinus TaxID=48563 RepID=UPI001B879838|nr:uncharacterized protein EDB93DRAFT_563109 [Suillus bovinus]KAG2158734.1 hypothetical protein EDB93DRAFT_563109 [Suillus bovinus]